VVSGGAVMNCGVAVTATVVLTACAVTLQSDIMSEHSLSTLIWRVLLIAVLDVAQFLMMFAAGPFVPPPLTVALWQARSPLLAPM
jgi:hypothetical protein